MRKATKRVKIAWYKLIYDLNDDGLIKYFWFWYNTHKVKSKDRAARNVLMRYYSTTSMPERVKKLLCLNNDIKTVSFNLYEL